MNLAELITAVYTETNRPDLVNETLQSVLEATLSCHLVDNWKCDLIEAGVQFDVPGYIQILDTSSIPNFRQATYLRKTDPCEGYRDGDPNYYNVGLGGRFQASKYNFLEEIELGDILDRYGYEKNDVWYSAGTQINIKSTTNLQYLLVGYYKYPILDSNAFSSWIAMNLPYMIVYRASGSLFSKIGETASASIYMRPPNGGKMDEGGMYYSQLALMIKTQTISKAW